MPLDVPYPKGAASACRIDHLQQECSHLDLDHGNLAACFQTPLETFPERSLVD